MRVQAIPIFQDMHILRRDMLEALTDYAFLADQMLYKGYGDGILSGCCLTTTSDAIILNEGAIFFEGEIFFIKEPMSVTYYPTNTTTVMKIRFSEQLRDKNFIYREIDLNLTEQVDLQKGELELCRFKLQEGARLRYQYQNFSDRNTEFDTLNTIYAAYSALGGSSISLEIVKEFAEEMLKAKGLSDLDVLFCLQLLGQDRPINNRVLTAYIERKMGRPLTDSSNLTIYKGLEKLLKEAHGGRKAGDGTPEKKRWRLAVD